MSQARTGKVNYRCPVCLFREIDYDLLYDHECDQYYCRRCNWEGDEPEILQSYAFYKRRYKDLLKRWTVEEIIAKDETD